MHAPNAASMDEAAAALVLGTYRRFSSAGLAHCSQGRRSSFPPCRFVCSLLEVASSMNRVAQQHMADPVSHGVVHK